ncbi:MAG: hypothetical protein EXS35_08885 [Pedosphaera sp.]|nr:hypothetical protein [Pedosphaera sp.]
MARFHSHNVLHVAPDRRRLWQFDARKNSGAPGREHTVAHGEPLPFALVTKTWRSLWQPKLNIAWLPPENVFLRVAQLPKSSFEETRAMVELQLEKLSPIPVTQVVWSMHMLPQSAGELQTVIVVLAERDVVEKFLGSLEGQGYLADRLEIPVLDQLQATTVKEDGAWIYPAISGEKNAAVVAWWSGGTLHNLNTITVPETGDPAAGLAAQLSQLTLAGELEGWLKATPAWHLVAEDAVAVEWENMLRPALEAPMQLSAPVPATQLAALTAQRSAASDPQINLLPREFSKRYDQQFHDRLWMRGLGAVVAVYCVGVVIYLAALSFASWRTSSVESKVTALSESYTNAMQMEARLEVLKDREALKFAALDCWKAIADSLPEALQLDGFNFSEGHKLALNGSAPAGSDKAILDFHDELRKLQTSGQALFDVTKVEPPNYRQGPGGTLTWNFALELKRAEAQ